MQETGPSAVNNPADRQQSRKNFEAQTTLNTDHSLQYSITNFGDIGVDNVTFCSSCQGRRESRGFLVKSFLPHKNFADDGFCCSSR